METDDERSRLMAEAASVKEMYRQSITESDTALASLKSNHASELGTLRRERDDLQRIASRVDVRYFCL